MANKNRPGESGRFDRLVDSKALWQLNQTDVSPIRVFYRCNQLAITHNAFRLFKFFADITHPSDTL